MCVQLQNNNEHDNSEISIQNVTLNFSPAGNITGDIRFNQRLGTPPNFSSTSFQKNFVYH